MVQKVLQLLQDSKHKKKRNLIFDKWTISNERLSDEEILDELEIELELKSTKVLNPVRKSV